MRVTSLYICPWSLRDPLCQSQTLPYLFGLIESGYKFALITFENPKFALAAGQRAEQQKQLEARGIYWYPVAYHQGLSLRAKAIDNYNGIVAGLKAWRRHKPPIVHSRTSLPTLIAVAVSKLTGSLFLYDADSILSEEYADNGHWSRKSNGFRAMAAAEKTARRSAARIIVLSELLKEDLRNDFRVKVPIDVIPCCVDTEKFHLDSETRKRRRRELGLTDEKLFVYVGKVGGRYLVGEMFDFFKAAQSEIKSIRLLIVSQDAPETIRKIAAEKEIGAEFYRVKSGNHDEVREYLSAADVGLAFIRNLRSERGGSPIKVAEYLAAGLPVVITDNVGDCSRLIDEKKVGAIVKHIDRENYLTAVSRLAEIWTENAAVVSARCRRTAEEKFSLENVGIARYRDIYENLLKRKIK